MSYTATAIFSFGASQTGLVDLTVQPLTAAGAATGSPVAGTFVAQGMGVYAWSGTVPDDALRGRAYRTGDATVLSVRQFASVLAPAQPLYAPAKAGDAMAITASAQSALVTAIVSNNSSQGQQLYAASSWSSLSGLTVIGQSPTVVAGAIRLAPSSPGNFDAQAIEFPGTTTDAEAIDIEAIVRASGSGYGGGTNYGLAVGRRSVNAAFAVSAAGQLGAATSPATFNLWPQASGVPGTQISPVNLALPSGMSVAANDLLRLTYTQRASLLGFRVENLTQGTGDYRTATATMVTPRTWGPPNASVVRLSALGGQFDILSVRATAWQSSRPNVAVIGDSKSAGYSAGDANLRWASLVPTLGPVAVYAGEGDRTADVLASLPAILANAPRQALLAVGRNDLAFGVASATWQANYASIASQLESAGVVVRHLLPIPETTQDQTALRAWLLATYPGKTIDPSVGWVDATHLHADAVHPSAAGHAFVAAAVTASGLLTPAPVGTVLTSDYDAAKTAATQASVNAIPTNPLLTDDARLPTSGIVATAANVSAIAGPTLTQIGDELESRSATLEQQTDAFLAALEADGTKVSQTLDAVLSVKGTVEATQNTVDSIASGTGGRPGAYASQLRYVDSTNGDAPIADADAWVTSDSAGATVVSSGQTNSDGYVTFYLDSGLTYYFWAQRDGFNPIAGQPFTAE